MEEYKYKVGQKVYWAEVSTGGELVFKSDVVMSRFQNGEGDLLYGFAERKKGAYEEALSGSFKDALGKIEAQLPDLEGCTEGE